MIDCECGRGDFSGCTNKPQRDQLTIDLIQLILKRELFMLGFTVMLDGSQSSTSQITRCFDGQRRSRLSGYMYACSRAGRAVSERRKRCFFDWKEKNGDAFKLIDEFRSDERLGMAA